jgi:hypothetical protein
MHTFRIGMITALVILLSSTCLAAWSQQSQMYSNSELDEILAPIALYPDPLVAQILPAATFPDQLAEAQRLIQRSGSSRDIDNQNWDVSVQAIAYYPSVLDMMVAKPDWTIAVGQAYVDQPDDVMRSIQRLRNTAKSYGYLSTNSYERVYLDSGYIRIVPVQAGYIYVPQYDPEVVYVQRQGSSHSNAISFGAGLLIGSWLNRDVDWGHNKVYYHGWSGKGWIGQSKPVVKPRLNTHYVSNTYKKAPINVDRKVKTRDISSFRNTI